MRFLLSFSVYAERLNDIHFDLLIYNGHLFRKLVQDIYHEFAQKNNTFVFTLVHFQSLKETPACIRNVCRKPIEKLNDAKSKVTNL